MPRGQPANEMSDFEKQRAANIAERDALLKKLALEAKSVGLYTKPPSKTPGVDTPKSKKKTPIKRIKKEEEEASAPRRTSSRLRGLTADSEVAKRKAEEEFEALQVAERAKRQRVSGDLAIGDILVNGKGWDGKGLLGVDVVTRGVAKPYERTFGEEQIKATTDKDLKAIREQMSNLQLWEEWDPTRIKITPERIYSMAFHPIDTKPLIFAGDKLGNLGILDASQKREVPGTDSRDLNPGDDEYEDDDDPDPVITTLKPHARTISAMHTHPSKPQTLYMASYDSSIRALDLEKSIAVETYAPADPSDDEPLSGVDMALTDPQVLYFTTLNGAFGRHDTRIKSDSPDATDLYALSEKKIGGFSLHPQHPHLFSTASLDRFMRLWDLRKLSKKEPMPIGEHESRLSVSHAAFNSHGQIATSSYDDSIKIYDYSKVDGGMGSWKPGRELTADEMSPSTVIRHNCQTGRWVTILRPQWHRSPTAFSHIPRLVIGNMNRFVDIYDSQGQQLAQLGGDGITAVPAVAMFHESRDWVVGGTASGKVCLWM